mmetsp:Transcript_13554/g.50459  ORF Transcript_13554/g.50459 Transcript_13554/m.50459 type:complete len:222 (-) Transcript_13554:1020-1685(-)
MQHAVQRHCPGGGLGSGAGGGGGHRRCASGSATACEEHRDAVRAGRHRALPEGRDPGSPATLRHAVHAESRRSSGRRHGGEPGENAAVHVHEAAGVAAVHSHGPGDAARSVHDAGAEPIHLPHGRSGRLLQRAACLSRRPGAPTTACTARLLDGRPQSPSQPDGARGARAGHAPHDAAEAVRGSGKRNQGEARPNCQRRGAQQWRSEAPSSGREWYEAHRL